jgi:hypothetical protein
MGRFERVVNREVDIKEEYTAMVRRAFRPGDSCAPFHNIIRVRTGTTVGWRIFHELVKFLLDAFRDTHFCVVIWIQ